jgi:hypothetical protein
LAEEPFVLQVLPDLRQDAPLRLLLALRYLEVHEGLDPWPDPVEVLKERAEWITSFTRETAVQTNEVQRSWGLVPCFLTLWREAGLGRPLDLIELGSSAGFNLLWDRYRSHYRAGVWGPAEAKLELRGQERRPVPGDLLRLRPTVRRRTGIELRPIDVATPEAMQLLELFVWPGNDSRIDRLRRAASIVRAEQPPIVVGDYVKLLPALLRARDPDALTIVYQTASTGYLSNEQRALLIEALLVDGVRQGGLGWVSTLAAPDQSVNGWALEVHSWPSERAWPEEPRLLAHFDFHGEWIEWLE